MSVNIKIDLTCDIQSVGSPCGEIWDIIRFKVPQSLQGKKILYLSPIRPTLFSVELVKNILKCKY